MRPLQDGYPPIMADAKEPSAMDAYLVSEGCKRAIRNGRIFG